MGRIWGEDDVLVFPADQEQRRDVIRAAAGAPGRAPEERGAGMPRRRRNLAAVMANRRPQRADEGKLQQQLSVLFYHIRRCWWFYKKKIGPSWWICNTSCDFQKMKLWRMRRQSCRTPSPLLKLEPRSRRSWKRNRPRKPKERWRDILALTEPSKRLLTTWTFPQILIVSIGMFCDKNKVVQNSIQGNKINCVIFTIIFPPKIAETYRARQGRGAEIFFETQESAHSVY